MVNTENIIDHMSSPIDNLVARPFMRIVAERNSTKYIMLSIIDV